jgi:hypothetical protein
VGLTDFADIHAGETVWVLGSGASLQSISPRLLARQTVVATNFAGTTAGLEWFYSVAHHHSDADRIAVLRPDLLVFTPTVEQLPPEDQSPARASEPNVVFVPTSDQHYSGFDPEAHWPTDDDRLVVGPTSLHMAMHLAAYMGAADIVLVGADCGAFDNASRIADYPDPDGHLHYGLWTRSLEAMAARIRSLGVGVHSLNPWVTPRLEGHRYETEGLTING